MARYGRTILLSGIIIVKLFVFCGQEVFLILMLILVQFLRILAPKPGGGEVGLNTLRKDPKPTHAVFVGCLVYPSFRPSFIEIGVMACITPAWSSHELSLNSVDIM